MSYWWVSFMERPDKFIFAPTKDEALVKAATFGNVIGVEPLPYPPIETPDGAPALCYAPERCAGNTACPQHPACSE